jgi:hypothetical protein
MAEQYRLENYKAKRERAHKSAYTGPSAMCTGISFLIRRVLVAVLGIRIRILRIRMFLGLPDPDPDLLVRGKDPDLAPDPSPFLINVLSGLK